MSLPLPPENEEYVLPETDELHVGEIFALRKFEYSIFEKVFKGLTFKQPISPDQNYAQCPLHPHQAPHPGCSCGFYAFDTHKWFNENRLQQNLVGPREIKTVVKLSGKIVVSERGLKAECMEVVAYCAPITLQKAAATNFPNAQPFGKVSEMVTAYNITPVSRETQDTAKPSPAHLKTVPAVSTAVTGAIGMFIYLFCVLPYAASAIFNYTSLTLWLIVFFFQILSLKMIPRLAILGVVTFHMLMTNLFSSASSALENAFGFDTFAAVPILATIAAILLGVYALLHIWMEYNFKRLPEKTSK